MATTRVTLGTDKVTATQRNLLAEASSGSSRELIQALVRVYRDDDITAGTEELLPAWVELFEQRKSELSRINAVES